MDERTPQYMEDINEIAWEMMEPIYHGRLPNGDSTDPPPDLEDKLYNAIQTILCDYYKVYDYRRHM